MKLLSCLVVLIFFIMGFCGVCFAKTMKVMTSIGPVGYLVERVAGDGLEVGVMMPDSANPHTYEPLPSDLVKLSRVDIYFELGVGLDFENVWLPKLKRLNNKMKVVNCGKAVVLQPVSGEHVCGGGEAGCDHDHNHDHGLDPHIWLSINNAIVMVGNIREALVNIVPENRVVFENNAKELVLELEQLKKEIQNKLKQKTNKKFIVFHPSWGYFARDFGLEQIPVEIDGKEPSIKEVRKLIMLARKEGIKTVFVSPQFSKKSAAVIAKEIGGQVVAIDPMAKDYIKNIRKVGEALINN